MSRKTTFYLIATLLLSACNSSFEIETESIACSPAPQALSCARAFSINGILYIFGGRNAEGKYSNELYSYDPTTDTWALLDTPPLQGRVYATATVIGEEAYIGLGFNGKSIYQPESYLNDFWCYRPSDNSWTRLADYPDHHTNTAVSFVWDGKIYAGFGFFEGFSRTLYAYDPTNDCWIETEQHTQAGFPPRVCSAVATTYGERCFLGTGFRHGSHSFWVEFLPETSKWRRCASLPGNGRHNAACTTNTQGIWVFGGWHYGDPEGNGKYLEDILCYDPEQDCWARGGVMPCGKTMNMVAATAGNTVYYGLGESPDGKPLNTFYRIGH